MYSDLLQPTTHKLEQLDIKQTPRILVVSISQQLLLCFENRKLTRSFEVSTSKNPPSCVENSFGTPTGIHRIEQKIGDGADSGAVFRGRVDIGKRYWELSEEDQKPNLVTTRILWLTGLEPGHNQGPGRDSFDRYIYFHGTNHEEEIGSPASGGCVQLRNSEMIDLYDFAEPGDLVDIRL